MVPECRGLGTTLNKFVSVERATTGDDRVLVSNTDHTSFLSSNNLKDVDKFATKLSNVNVGYASAFVGDRVYLAIDNDAALAQGKPTSQLVSMPAKGGSYMSEEVPGTGKSKTSTDHVAGVTGWMKSSTQRQIVIALTGPDQGVYLRTDTFGHDNQWHRSLWQSLTESGGPPCRQVTRSSSSGSTGRHALHGDIHRRLQLQSRKPQRVLDPARQCPFGQPRSHC